MDQTRNQTLTSYPGNLRIWIIVNLIFPNFNFPKWIFIQCQKFYKHKVVKKHGVMVWRFRHGARLHFVHSNNFYLKQSSKNYLKHSTTKNNELLTFLVRFGQQGKQENRNFALENNQKEIINYLNFRRRVERAHPYLYHSCNFSNLITSWSAGMLQQIVTFPIKWLHSHCVSALRS